MPKICTNDCLEWDYAQRMLEFIETDDFMFCPYCGCDLENES
jgi:hypothetical protein